MYIKSFFVNASPDAAADVSSDVLGDINYSFLTFFDTSQTERAMTFPSFSDKPYAKQDDMCGNIMKLNGFQIFLLSLISSKRM